MPVKTIDELFDWTDLTSDGEQRSKPLTERDGDVFFVIHHAYNRKVQDTIALSKPGGRTVSMSSALGPTTAGVESPIFNVQVVRWNTRRPWTTSSSIDDKAYTVECSNINLNEPYPVAQAIKKRLAEIAAALHVQTGMPLDTWHILDHAEVYRRGWGSYATACCGADLRAAIPWIIAEAKRIVAEADAPVTPERKKSMSTLFYKNKANDRAKPADLWALAGDGEGEAGWLEITDGALANELANIHGRNVFLTESTFETWKQKYLSGVRKTSG